MCKLMKIFANKYANEAPSTGAWMSPTHIFWGVSEFRYCKTVCPNS